MSKEETSKNAQNPSLRKGDVMPRCSSCKHWNNKQAELDYSTFYGICTSHKWKFITTENADIRILDRNNRSKKHMGVHTFENQNAIVPIGEVERSQYCFVTNENFGCIHFNSN